jgi:predicted HicB family RNase H-like nuclease
MDKTEYELVTIDLPLDDILTLCLMAHEQDITLNKLINQILIEAVNREEKL